MKINLELLLELQITSVRKSNNLEKITDSKNNLNKQHSMVKKKDQKARNHLKKLCKHLIKLIREVIKSNKMQPKHRSLKET